MIFFLVLLLVVATVFIDAEDGEEGGVETEDSFADCGRESSLKRTEAFFRDDSGRVEEDDEG